MIWKGLECSYETLLDSNNDSNNDQLDTTHLLIAVRLTGVVDAGFQSHGVIIVEDARLSGGRAAKTTG